MSSPKHSEDINFAGIVIDKTLQNVSKLLLLSWAVALVLTKTSAFALLNLPMAIALVFGARWLWQHVEQQQQQQHPASSLNEEQKPTHKFRKQVQSLDASAYMALAAGLTQDTAGEQLPPAAANIKADQNWRAAVGSPLVEHAWETLCGSIIQEFIYDAWYTAITPDREFPAETRRILNNAFGVLARRARRLDARALIRDVTDLVIQHLELYRDTRYSIWGQEPPDANPVKRERAFRNEMQADGNLHPALGHADGHYKVLRGIAEGLAVLLLDKNEAQRTITRVFVRELFASSVLRPIMMLLTPYTINKAVFGLLQEQVQRKQALDPEDVAAVTEAAPQLQTGLWQFEARLRESAQMEDDVLAAKEHKLRQRSMKQQQYIQQRQQQQKAMEALKARSTTSPNPTNSGGRLESMTAGTSQTAMHVDGQRTHGAADANAGMSGGSLTKAAAAAVGRSGASPDKQPFMAGVRTASQRGHSTSVSAGHAAAANSFHQESAGSYAQPDSPTTAAAPGSTNTSPTARQRAMQRNDTAPARMSASTGHSTASVSGRDVAEFSMSLFKGRPRATVVAAELNMEAGKEYVSFKIRVVDELHSTSEQWTVDRRYRNFEELHRRLRNNPAYKLKLPPKRVFFHNQNVEFVEERRQDLDRYLQAMLLDAFLAVSPDVHEFLHPHSEIYQTEGEAGFFSKVSGSVSDVRFSMKKGMAQVGGVIDDIDSKRKKSMAAISKRFEMPVLAIPDMNLVPNVMRSISSKSSAARMTAAPDGAAAPASRSFRDLVSFGSSSTLVQRNSTADAGAAATATESPQDAAQSRQQSMVTRDASRQGGAILSATGHTPAGAAAAAQLLDVTPARSAATPAVRPTAVSDSDDVSSSKSTTAAEQIHPSGRMPHSASTPSLLQTAAAAEQSLHSSDGSAGDSRQASPQQEGVAALVLPPRGQSISSPVPQGLRRPITGSSNAADVGHISTPTSAAKPEDSFSSARSLPLEGSSTVQGTAASRDSHNATESSVAQESAPPELRGSQSNVADPGMLVATDPPAGDAIDTEDAALMRQRLDSSSAASTSAATSRARKEGGCLEEDATGISAPLYALVDSLFQLQSRGFFRQGVFSIARQTLSLIAGAAIDEALLKQLNLIKQEHTIARLLHRLQSSLWPGGRWYSAMQAATSAEQGQVRHISTPENFLISTAPPPVDAEEVAAAVRKLLEVKAPAALVALLGKQCYLNGVGDLYDMWQSTTFVQQVGYGLLEILFCALFPEMEPIFRNLKK